jgi:hypothetical protein
MLVPSAADVPTLTTSVATSVALVVMRSETAYVPWTG